MAAVITAKGSTFDTNTGTHTVTATPAANDYIVIVCANSGITASPTVTDNNADGLGTYTEQVSANKDTSTDKVFIFTRDAVVGSATSTIFSVTGASSTGGGLAVFSVTGILAAGTAGVRQVGYVENQATGIPIVAMTRNVVGPVNPIITAVFNDTNPGGVTVPSGYTADYSIGYATPTTGLRVAHHNACPTYTNTITWGGTSASNYGAVAIELNAVVSSVASTGWNTASTWSSGAVPTDQQSVAIAPGDTVTYDFDMTGWTGLSALNIYGTLQASRVTSSYLYIKAAAIVGGNGVLDWGYAGNAIPFAVKAVFTGGANFYFQGNAGLTIKIMGAEPAIKCVKLSAPAIVGNTVLNVDTSVAADIWAAGDSVVIDRYQASTYEDKIIALGGIAAGTITITVGLAVAKAAGSRISLATRNVRFVGNTGKLFTNFASGKFIIAGGEITSNGGWLVDTITNPIVSGGMFHGGAYVFYGVTGFTISGGVFTGNSAYLALNSTVAGTITGGYFGVNGTTAQFYSCTGIIISGGEFWSGGYGIYICNGADISGGTFFGTNNGAVNGCPGANISGGSFTYCLTAVVNCLGVTISGGTFDHNTNGLSSCSGIVKNATFTNNTYDLLNSVVTCFNTLLGSTENSGYLTMSKQAYCESLDHDQTPGKFAAWTKGGATVSATATPPTGFTQYNVTTCADASNEAFWQREIVVGAGASVNITMWLRKHISMTWLPRIQIFNKALADPFAGGATINTFTMTDSIDTWELQVYTYYNSTANDVTLIIRPQGKNASGDIWAAVRITQINVDLTTLTNNVAALDAIVDDIHDTDLPEANADLDELITTLGVAGAGLTAIPNSAGVSTILADYARRTGDYATVGAKMDLNDDLKNIAGAAGYDRTTDSLEALGTNIPGTPPLLGTDGAVLISTDTQDLSGSLSVNIGKWLGVVPTALSATGHFIQAMLMRWKSDDAVGTPLDLTAANKVQADAGSFGTLPGLGTDGNVLISTDAQDLSGSLDVNAKNIGGTAQTGNDIGLDVNDILTDTGTTLPATLTEIIRRVKNAIAMILAK